MNFKVAVLSGFLFFSAYQLKAQIETDETIEDILESINESSGEEFDSSELLERLNYYRRKPFNLNKVSADQLQELIFLSPPQILAIINHRNANGKFADILELQSIDVLDPETIKKLSLFCTLGDGNIVENVHINDLISRGSNELMFTYGQVLQKQKGYLKPEQSEQSHYLGSPQRVITRYRYHYGQNISASISMKKDAGEPFSLGKQRYGFDFYSGNISFKGSQLIKKIVLGDYSLQFGQGLTMWSGLSFGKGAAVATITKNNIGLKPYSSTNELLFLRGLAGTINFKKIDITPFVSYRFIDGSLEIKDNAEEISSVSATGFHRTQNELDKKGSVKQLIFGANAQYSNQGLRVGAILYQTNLNHAFEVDREPYKLYEFVGDRLSNLGAYYNYNWRNIYFFGEAGHSMNSGYAFLNGLLSSLTPQISLILFHRTYQKNYHSFFNQAVSEGTNAVNERGFYTGLVISPNKKTEFNVYIDFFKFPWVRYRVDAPSAGCETLSQFTYSPSKRLKAIVRYKFEQKEENSSGETMNVLTEVKKQNYRFELSYKISKSLQLRNRAEIVFYKKDIIKEQGVLMYQDVIFHPMSSFLSGNFRFAIFDTAGFNSRLYAFENDVLYSYSVPAYQNKGTRFYANARCRVNKSVDFWLKYSLTSYTDLTSIGTGLDKIDGNKKSDVKFQLRFQF